MSNNNNQSIASNPKGFMFKPEKVSKTINEVKFVETKKQDKNFSSHKM